MSEKMSLSNIVDPKTKLECEFSINQVTWIFVISWVSMAFKAFTILWVKLETGLDSFNAAPGTFITSLSGIFVVRMWDVVIFAIAILFFRLKRSFYAACMILLIAVIRGLNILLLYFYYDISSVRITAVAISILLIFCAIIGVRATYRYRSYL